MPQEWKDLQPARDLVKSRLHFNQYWLVLFDHDQAAQHVMQFEHEFFAASKDGYEQLIVPLFLGDADPNQLMYTLTIMIVAKYKVSAVQMARFMNSICKLPVAVSDLEDTNQICWSDQKTGEMLFQMFDLFMGTNFEITH